MITARYKWEIGTLCKGLAIHRKTLRVTKFVPIVAIFVMGWGAYEAITTERS